MRWGLVLLSLMIRSCPQNDDNTFRAPVNEQGEPCPFPIDPLLLVGMPLGQYHCPYCLGMQVAGFPHLDWMPVLNNIGI